MLSPQDGYFFVPDDADDVTATAATGETLRLPSRAPPWLIVDHAIETIVVARWPGRLWRVDAVDADGIDQPAPPAQYARVAALRLGEELPAWRLFGERGQSVAAVIAAASRVEIEDVEALAASRDPDAGRAYARAWRRWLTSIGVGRVDIGDDLDGTLAIPVNGRQSPINYGFAVISRALEARAESLVGDAAFVTTDDGERWLERTWSAAACALLEAAMSFGSPEASREDAPTLAAAFRAAVERQ